MQIIPNSKLGYLAGYFEGEGTVHFGIRKDNVMLRIRIVSGDKIILDEFEKYFGGRVYAVKGGTNRQLYRWEASGERAQFVLVCFLPFLMQKRRLANLGLDCTFVNHGKVSDEERTKRLNIFNEARDFNSRKTINV